MKRMSLIKILLLILIAIVIILYQLPATKKDFFKLYKKKDYASKSLKEFYKKQTKNIVVNGVKWKYLTSGNSKKVILFLQGMGGGYDLWWQQVDYFDKDYKTITYTLPERIDNLDGVLTGIKAILKKENVDKFTAVGTSMGGYIAQYLLKQMPERLNKVVFGNTFPPNDDLLKDNLTKSKIIPFLPEIVVSYFGQKSLKNKLFPAGHNDSLLEAFLPSLPFSKKSFINRFKIVVDHFTINPSIYKYKRVLKLIMESDNDPLIPLKLRKKLKALYPDAKVHTFHNEGHFPYINATKEYNEVLRTFLNKENSISEIESVVHNYFKGRKDANINLLENAFSEDAKLMYSDNKKIYIIPINDYLTKVKQEGPKQIETQILSIDKEENMGFAKTEFKYTNKNYIDYLTLLKRNDNWKIVSKTFCKVP